jgi:hypothetical protein
MPFRFFKLATLFLFRLPQSFNLGTDLLLLFGTQAHLFRSLLFDTLELGELAFLFFRASLCVFLDTLALFGGPKPFLFHSLALSFRMLPSLFFGLQSCFLFNAPAGFFFGFQASLLRSLTARFTFGSTAALRFCDAATLFFFSLAQCFYLTTNPLLFLSSLTRFFLNALSHDLQLGKPAFLFSGAQARHFYQTQSLLFGEAAGFFKSLPFFLRPLMHLSLELQTLLLSQDSRFFFSLYASLFD